jgi:E3 ubiquitin-protein ligase ZNRF1/2
MGGRLTTPPSSNSSSSTTAHRTSASNSTSNLPHTRTHSNSTNHNYQQQTGHHRHRSNSTNHNSHVLFSNNSTNNNRHRTTSTNLDPLNTTAFNLNLLRYVGLDHESDDQSSDDDSPQSHRRLQHFIITLRDVHCPVCNKTIPSDSFDKHILQCLSKPRIDYNEDTLTEDKGECVICLDDLLIGQKIARLPCLCIYHKGCIDNWFRINRTCPEHPGD